MIYFFFIHNMPVPEYLSVDFFYENSNTAWDKIKMNV